MSLDDVNLHKVLDAMESSDWTDIHLRGEDWELRLSTSADSPQPVGAAVGIPAPPSAGKPGPVCDNPVAPASHTAPAIAERPQSSADDLRSRVTVASPSVGIFWRAPSPTSPPFVDIGDHVTTHTTLCIIEVMKLMTQVASKISGTITDVLVENGAQVEQGQPLFLAEPDEPDLQ